MLYIVCQQMKSWILKLDYQTKYVNFRMGNIQDAEQELTFIQTNNQPPFGQIQIYQSKSGLFLMKRNQTEAYNHINLKSSSKILTFALQYHPNLIPIVKVIEHEQFGMCGKVLVSEIYTEYYNYTLRDVLLSKKTLEEAELWFILKSLLNLVDSLQDNRMMANLCLQNVFVTLGGNICISHYEIKCCEFSLSEGDHSMLQMIAKVIIELSSNKFIENYCKVTELDTLKTQTIHIAQKHRLIAKIIQLLLLSEVSTREIIDYINRLAQQDSIRVATEIKLIKFKLQLPPHVQSINHQLFSQHLHSTISQPTEESKEGKEGIQSQMNLALREVKEVNNGSERGLKVNVNITNEMQKKQTGSLMAKKATHQHNQSTVKKHNHNESKFQNNIKKKLKKKVTSLQKNENSTSKKEQASRLLDTAPKTFLTEYSSGKEPHFNQNALDSSQKQKGVVLNKSQWQKAKMFQELQRKKSEYQHQKQRFKQKKQEVLLWCLQSKEESLRQKMIASKIENLKTQEKRERTSNYSKKHNQMSSKCHYR